MKHTLEELADMLDELGQWYLIVERYRGDNDEKEYEEQKEKILNIFEELMKEE